MQNEQNDWYYQCVDDATGTATNRTDIESRGLSRQEKTSSSGLSLWWCQGEELYHSAIAPEPERLIATLKRFEPSEVHTVYEAGPTGYWLHDALVEAGFYSMVAPPLLVPHIGGRDQELSEPTTGGAACFAYTFCERGWPSEEQENRNGLRISPEAVEPVLLTLAL